MKGLWILVLAVSLLTQLAAMNAREASAMSEAQLSTYLKQHAVADTDGDGVLTREEYAAHLPQASLKKFGTDGIHRHYEIPLRDGYTVPAEVYLPSKGEGPWPVLLTRAEYGRWIDWNVPAGDSKGVVYVIHDTREWNGGMHASWQDSDSSLNELEDGADVLDWIAAQPWCNGRIGTAGGSGHGYASDMMFWANHPNYLVNGTENTAGNIKHYWSYHNGVRRGTSYNWMTVRGVPLGVPSHPTLPQTPYDPETWKAFMQERSAESQTWYFNNTGWFDPMSQGAIDSFEALQDTGRAFVRVEPRCHGGIRALPDGLAAFPTHGENQQAVQPPSTLDMLLGAEPDEAMQSTLTYFLMGDVLDPAAPGNHFMVTHEWPVPHEQLALYLHADGSLAPQAPSDVGSVSYTYDPKDPAPTIGGHHDWGQKSGPEDQRPLRERDDVLYFVTEPLQEPLAITGNLSMRLAFSSDVPDTAFVVKVVDIYPDGTEFIVRESAGMARYHSGYASPSPIEPGNTYQLDLDLWSTAIVFNKGHRIAVIVTSSSKDSYEVHPNSYEPVSNYTDAPVAQNTIHCSPEQSSVLFLPRVPLP